MAALRRLKVVPKTAPKTIKLDIGCGRSKREGFVGMDVVGGDGVDVLHDWDRTPWPFENDSVEEINASHVLEHTRDLIAFMEECHRILVPEGKMAVVSPYYSSVRAWQDPTHVRAISEWTFLYFNRGWREQNKLTHYPITADFDFAYGYALHPNWVNRSQEARDFAIQHYINVVSDIMVTLTKRPVESVLRRK